MLFSHWWTAVRGTFPDGNTGATGVDYAAPETAGSDDITAHAADVG